MADEQGSPFRDPQHPSWYSEPGSPHAQGGQPANPYAQGGQAANPYAQGGQPAGLYGQPGAGQYAGHPGGYPGHPPAAFPAQEPKTMSIIALVLGIVSVVTLGMLFLTQIAAVVLGHLALRREPAGRGMAIAGLVMGYVVIGLWALFVVFIVMLAGVYRA